MQKIMLVVFVLLLSALLVGFTRPQPAVVEPIDVTVTLKDFKLVLSQTNLPAGVPIRFTFVDMGKAVHEAVLEESEAVDEPIEMPDAPGEVENIHPGESKTIIWTFDKPGDYKLACHIPGHFEAGMFQKFKVWQGGPLVAMLMERIAWIAGGLGVLVVLAIALVITRRRMVATASAV